jgi:hypothetical protein
MLSNMKISAQFMRATQDNLGEQGKALVEKLPALLSLSIDPVPELLMV